MYENALSIAEQVKEQAKRKIELLQKPFLYEKQTV